ncbi:possible hybride transferase/ F420-dependent dehydrogenase (plasmid) [Rhodococcus jostii RHA1]|uniref:Possible hybride transferase/ F420-dependent dehydrogenase n=1 Tax=Rhodococcus jostii (strain RHA1) TaxID=101510 RepID=Q0RV75_RHOJR|nr:TIGR03619 family F420-dependent LLM class oxidoreductase [Rhodococcus jostii]ABH00811.1 possible hybride transferase/ F420-dependent dehydrogenase [Rhodococcus jostii RHA1]
MENEQGLGLPKIGINLVPVHVGSLGAAAQTAEELGFESVWLGEHVITPLSDVSAAYPGKAVNFEPGSPLVEPLIALSHIAAATSTIRLGTSIVCLPLRDPLLTAREISTLDHLSGGRIELGAGLGWMREEYEAMGRDWRTRGSRLEEFVTVITGLLAGEPFQFSGKHFEIPPMLFGPTPLQSPHPPIHLGGQGPKALARCAALADGWIGGAKSADTVHEIVDELLALRRSAGLPTDDFDISVIVLHPPTVTELRNMRARGVRRVIVTPWQGNDGPPFPGITGDLAPLNALADELGL